MSVMNNVMMWPQMPPEISIYGVGNNYITSPQRSNVQLLRAQVQVEVTPLVGTIHWTLLWY
jgi:hypothetical protein